MKQIIFVSIFFLYFLSGRELLAQDINNLEGSNGEIICSNTLDPFSELRKNEQAYDPFVMGIFYKSPIKQEILSSNVFVTPLKREGVYFVKFNSESGPIKKGDLLTSSSESGVGMKATKSGMVIGIALEDATGTSGLIKTRVLIQYVKQ